MANLKDEVAQAVYSMYEALTVFGEAKNLATPIGRAASDFNALLSRAQAAYCPNDTLDELDPLRPDDPVVTLLSRLAVLKGGIDAQMIRRLRHPVRASGPKVVHLPLPARPTPRRKATAPPPDEYDLPDLSGVIVLLAEDTVSLRELLRIGLAQCGAVIDVADSLEAALNRLRARRPDIIVFDVRLPEGGLALAAAARAHTLPAIALSARHLDTDLEALLDSYRVRLLRTFDQVTVASAVKHAVNA